MTTRQPRELGEVGNERRQDFVNDPVVDFGQHGLHGRTIDGFWRTFPERYIQGRGALHIHFRPSVGGRVIPQDYCAFYNGAKVGPYGEGVEVGEVDSDGADIKDPQVGESVLVFDRKIVKYREDVRSRVLSKVPSSVRLQFLDDCLRSWVDAPDCVTAFSGVHRPVGEDREFRSPEVARQRANVQVPDSQLVNEVVQGGAKVVQTISGDSGELRRYRLQEFDYHQLLASLEVEIMEEVVRLSLEPSSGFFFKALQVIERPI